MKKIVFIIVTVVAYISTGCEIHERWDDSFPEMEHVYYIGFYKTEVYTNYLSYEVAQSGSARWRFGSNATSGTWISTDEQWTATIPFQFYSERVRSYDAVCYFWVYNLNGSDLTVGVDYTVTLENGTTLTPNTTGAYSLTWPQTKKGIQNVKIKRLGTSPNGALRVNLYNPADDTPVGTDPATTIQNKTNEYEIRCMTHDNDRVAITFTN